MAPLRGGWRNELFCRFSAFQTLFLLRGQIPERRVVGWRRPEKRQRRREVLCDRTEAKFVTYFLTREESTVMNLNWDFLMVVLQQWRGVCRQSGLTFESRGFLDSVHGLYHVVLKLGRSCIA